MPNMRGRVLIVDPDNFTPLYDVNLARALVNEGWDVEWVTSPHQFDRMPDAFPAKIRESFFARIKCPPAKDFLHSVHNPQRLRKILKAACYPMDLALFTRSFVGTQPGIIHAQWALFPYLDAIFWKTLRRMGWLIVFTCHDPIPLRGSLPRFYLRATNHLCSSADAIVVHGKWARGVLMEAGVPSEKIHIIDPGPPIADWLGDRESARRSLGLNPTIPVVLFFGYIKQYKGLLILLESLPLIRRAAGDFILIIAGEMMDDWSKYRQRVATLDIAGLLRWSDGYVPQEMSLAYFAAADIVVLPYLEASSSGVLLSAYTARKPVVASGIGDIPAMVADGETGILVSPGNPAELSRALADLMLDRQKAELMGTRGHELVRTRFNWERIAGLTGKLYCQLLRSGR